MEPSRQFTRLIENEQPTERPVENDNGPIGHYFHDEDADAYYGGKVPYILSACGKKFVGPGFGDPRSEGTPPAPKRPCAACLDSLHGND